MKIDLPLFFLFPLSFFLSFASFANDVKPYAEVAKGSKDSIILCIGTGWMKDSDKYKEQFRLVAQATSGDVEWALYDRPSGLKSEEVNALGKLPCEIYSYPALIYRDGEGRPIFQRENVPLVEFQKLGPLVVRTAKMRVDRDVALKSARAMPSGPRRAVATGYSDGELKAAALGKALSPLLDPVLSTYSERAIPAYQNSVKSIVAEMKAADPLDLDGWALKYSFNYFDFAKGQQGDKFEKVIEKPALLPNQKQMLYALVFKRELDKLDAEEPVGKAIKPLEDGIALDPRSTIAQGMRNMRDYYTRPVALKEMRWTKRDNRPRWQRAFLDASSVAKVGGIYKVTFKEAAGGTKFRKVRFRGGAEGEQLDFGGKSWRCRFPGEDKAVLELELKGSGWFDGHGDIVIEPDS